MKNKLRTLGALFLSILVLAGCASPWLTLGAGVLVKRATREVVQHHPERAARAVALAAMIEELTAETETATTIDMLEAAVLVKIKWADYLPEEQDLIRGIITGVADELRKLEANGNLPSDQVWRVRLVARWIREAAEEFVQVGTPTPIPPGSSRHE